MHRRDFEEIARNLAEARVLGLFASDNAHRLVVKNLADTLSRSNTRFDWDTFMTACGVQETSIEVREMWDAVTHPVEWVTAGTIRNGVVTTVNLTDEPEILVDCE